MRLGLDLGGTKIEGIVLDGAGYVLARRRVGTPRHDYQGTLSAIADLVRNLEGEAGAANLPLGMSTPGCVDPVSGLMKNCNSTWLNGRPLPADLENITGRSVRSANDADCLALSEAHDGAGRGAGTLFAAILGTGVGGGVTVHGQLLTGPNGGAGEWGHNPLPSATPAELSTRCWCGQAGCIETWLSGPGLAADHRAHGGESTLAHEIAAAVDRDPLARQTMERYEARLARALASVINLLDPDVIVLGGGLSNISRLYARVPRLWGQWVLDGAAVRTRLEPARHGDASGARGAARLWPGEDIEKRPP